MWVSQTDESPASAAPQHQGTLLGHVGSLSVSAFCYTIFSSCTIVVYFYRVGVCVLLRDLYRPVFRELRW